MRGIASSGIIVLATIGEAQTLSGTTGLLIVPTAEMPADGALTAGFNIVDSRFHANRTQAYGENTGLVRYAAVGFLPFVEVGVRLTRVMHAPRRALGDRMLVLRLRALKETARTPAIVVGAQDMVGTRRFHSTYVVATKHLDRVPGAGRVGLHLGYGGD